MSFWFTRRESDGKHHVYSVNAPPPIIIPVVAVFLVAIIGLIRGCVP
jgi:hypothetical protein